MTLGELALSVKWPFGLILDDEDVKAQAVNAARQYSAWGTISSISATSIDQSYPTLDDLDEFADMADGEWGVIKPLFMLYIERENARGLEASRSNGVDVYGRSVSEIDQSIVQYETVDMPRAAFMQLPESI